MSKTLGRNRLLRVVAVLTCAFCVFFAQSAFAAAGKPTVGKSTGLVVSTNWMADAVGQKILDEGGNAIDAAAAVGYALAVVHPTAGNIGGGGFAVIHLANGENYALDFREMAPGKAFREMYLNTEDPAYKASDPKTYKARMYKDPATGKELGPESLWGYKAAGVPGTVAGLNAMVERFGTKKVAEVIDPAVKLAENGFKLTRGTAESLNERREIFSYFAGTKKYFTKSGGSDFKPDELFVQKDLAATLKLIAEKGRDGFYKGKTADLIVADMPNYGGIITLDDLAKYEPKWRDPVKGTYRGYNIVSMSPPSSGGAHVVQMLNTMENENIGKLGFGSARTIWLMAEAMRYAYADRSEYMGDPDFVKVPVDKLTDKNYAKGIYKKIADYGFKARPSVEVKPGLGPIHEGTDTTHFSVVDSKGNAVGITYTINMDYGCKAAVNGAGFLMNNEMDDFMSVPGQPNGFGLIQGEANNIQPYKRPLSSMTPTIVLDGDKTFLVTGSPGGSTIITTVLHTITNVIDHGMNVSEANAAPRFHMQWMPDVIDYEAVFGFTNDTVKTLKSMGYTLNPRVLGDVDAIMVKDGVFMGANDPRTYDVPPALPLDLGK